MRASREQGHCGDDARLARADRRRAVRDAKQNIVRKSEMLSTVALRASSRRALHVGQREGDASRHRRLDRRIAPRGGKNRRPNTPVQVPRSEFQFVKCHRVAWLRHRALRSRMTLARSPAVVALYR